MRESTETAKRDFRVFLQNELLDRCRKNSSYSLRSFAKSLGIEASALSRIIRGKRSISKKMFERLSDRLDLDPMEKARYDRRVNSVEYSALALDSFKVISDWYHFAILELVRVRAFKTDPKWIAKALGITKSEANIALERLERLGLIEIESNEIKLIAQKNTTTNIIGSDEALRRLQKQILDKAINALDNTRSEKREQSAMTMAIDVSRLKEAKKKISEFRRELSEFLEAGEELQEVYQLSISLFPMTNLEEGEGHV